MMTTTTVASHLSRNYNKLQIIKKRVLKCIGTWLCWLVVGAKLEIYQFLNPISKMNLRWAHMKFDREHIQHIDTYDKRH